MKSINLATQLYDLDVITINVGFQTRTLKIIIIKKAIIIFLNPRFNYENLFNNFAQ